MLAIQWGLCYYHFIRPHQSLRLSRARQQTPVMAAGLTDHIWNTEEVLRTKIRYAYPARLPSCHASFDDAACLLTTPRREQNALWAGPSTKPIILPVCYKDPLGDGRRSVWKCARTAGCDQCCRQAVCDGRGESKIKFERRAVTLGEKGPIIYDWAALRILEQVDKHAGRSGWLLMRRSVSDPSEVAFYLSNADEKTPCSKLARVAATRFNIEMCFKLGKSETGLDQYEVRHHHSWYRHITLSMMALAWSAWRRTKRWLAKATHYLSRLRNPDSAARAMFLN